VIARTPHPRARPSPPPRGAGARKVARRLRAFTIIEILIAILILALLAAVLVPSFSGIDRRRAQVAVDELEGLLSTYAYRDALGGQPIALWRDPENGAVMLLVLELDESDPDAHADWVADRFTQPVVLPVDLEIVDVFIDRRRQNAYDWILTRVPGQPRPSLELDLLGPDDLAITLLITPTSLAATRLEDGRSRTALREAVDLDAIGADRQRW